MKNPADMNGLWSGTYGYHLIGDPVKFTAWFDDKAGRLAGSISEPNTFVPHGPDELEAAIQGVREGVMVDFAKTYSKTCGAHQHTLRYEGEADDKFTEVNGIWRLAGRGRAGGPFKLSRVSTGLEGGIERKRVVAIGDDGSAVSR